MPNVATTQKEIKSTENLLTQGEKLIRSSQSSSLSDIIVLNNAKAQITQIENVLPQMEKCNILLEKTKLKDPDEKLAVFYKDMSKKCLDKKNYESKVNILFANNPLDFVVFI
jgi:hypothetical protein